ncbi:juvenile hormone esterase [Uranotaenia lowii]|uniref:juvenile hormone esterase n=1 Tax=Uranotaenia lowii TaxID=190385 RepID=UPI002479B6A0|nr:juvenile hormone esterase [Uranotaenia lowii]XP_055584972.1 juvenile hormone esterase [Uranotaenia lowii]XP_055584977.1 juvenile hormone esterase [Uranotaenia lowii]
MSVIMKLLIFSLLTIGAQSSYGLPPSTLGDALASAGQLSNRLKETVAWKTFAGIARESDSINSLVRIIPQTTMGFVREVVNSFRQKESRIIVATRMGALEGRMQRVKGGGRGEIYAFKGIRYAQAPVGQLRFKAPLPELPWKGIKSALREGSVCPHRSMILDNFKGSEDCLFINVYTPDLPIGDYNPSFPVMVWIHGGAFSFGSGNAFLYGPDYLVPEGVILVTFNYRLGPLGFLGTGQDAPGNSGLKDQVLALKWVRDNIAAFGGNPKDVTIFGQSAGSVSVHMLMMSPMAKGLFHKAIAQSGTALNPWAITRTSKERAFRLGGLLGCQVNNSTEELLGCLRKTSAQKIMDAAMKTITAEDIKKSIGLPFVPSIENWSGEDASEEAPFLAEEPLEIMKRGNYNRVPLIVGFNSHEAMLFLRRVRKDPNLLQNIDRDFERLLPTNLEVDRDTDEGAALARRIRSFYLNDDRVSNNSIQNMMDLMTDVMFLHGISDLARLHATHDGQHSTWMYRFAYDGSLGIYKRILGIDWPGACHGDELGYLFHFGVLNIRLDNESTELQTMTKMTRMWTNFAKYSNPTPYGTDDPILGIRWPNVIPNTMAELPYLEITANLTARVNPESERLRFWDQTYAKYNGNIL